MKIQIATRLKPFSHTPGAACLIPGTDRKIEAYPTLLKIDGYLFEMKLTGPVSNFTLELDLERNLVSVFGKAKEGFYRLQVTATSKGFEIFADKVPKGELHHAKGTLKLKEKLFIEKEIPFFLSPATERLSLGNQKAQDWDLVWRRFDLIEILPALFSLGQKIPSLPNETLESIFDLESFCRAAFSKLMVPRLIDEDHQGLPFKVDPKIRPALLLISAKEKIRSLFFQQNDSHLSLLPHLIFPSGKMLNAQAKEIGEFDIEWTKGLLRQILFRAKKSGEIFLDMQKGITSYRLRTHLNQKGARRPSNERLTIEAGKTYYFDKFQK